MDEFQSAYTLGLERTIEKIEVDGIMHLMVPKTMSVESMAHLMDAPNRIKAHPSFNDVEGFAGYAKEFQEAGSRVFVDDINHSFVTVFDCHAKDSPAWCDHSASMKLSHSHEWNRFVDFNNKKLSAKQFAEFLEDNISYLGAMDTAAGFTSPADILTMAQTFKVRLKGELDVEDTLQAGVRKLIIKDDSTLSGRNADGKELSFPEKLNFNLRVFKNHHTYPITVWLRTRASKDGVTFWITIPDVDGIVEQAFDQVIDRVQTCTGLPTLKGQFDGPNHRRSR